MKIYKVLTLICLFAMSVMSQAQDATTVLNKVESNFKKDGDVHVDFVVSSNNETTDGSIDLSGQKFFLQLSELNVWFDGKTMWSYVKENMEVCVTTPTSSEIAKMNPYAFVSLYKDGYKSSFGKSTSEYYDIVLTSVNPSKTYKRISLKVSKSTYRLLYVKMTSDYGDMELNVKSYRKTKLDKGVFIFDKKKFPDVDVVDLR